MKTHKHAELIKAWADGAEIEYYTGKYWYSVPSRFEWDDAIEYRIKHEPKPDVIKYLNQLKNTYNGSICWEESDYQITNLSIALIFDGETGELKSAEVLK